MDFGWLQVIETMESEIVDKVGLLYYFFLSKYCRAKLWDYINILFLIILSLILAFIDDSPWTSYYCGVFQRVVFYFHYAFYGYDLPWTGFIDFLDPYSPRSSFVKAKEENVYLWFILCCFRSQNTWRLPNIEVPGQRHGVDGTFSCICTDRWFSKSSSANYSSFCQGVRGTL